MPQIPKQIILRYLTDKIYYSSDQFVKLDAIIGNIPKGFSYYKVEEYHKDLKHIVLSKINGSTGEWGFRALSKSNRHFFDNYPIEKITIQKSVYDDILTKPIEPQRMQVDLYKPFPSALPDIANLIIEKDPEDVFFKDGVIACDFEFKRTKEYVQVVIPNNFSKKEFDSVKKYFFKALGIKKMKFNIHVEYKDSIIETKFQSEDAERISESQIDYVIDRIVKNDLVKNENRGIIALDEIGADINSIVEETEGKDWLLRRLLTKENTKHYLHLNYLANNHAHSICKLKITGKPLSFIFLIPAFGKYFTVWETFDTQEATYIWMHKNLEIDKIIEYNNEIEENIVWLRGKNKMKFRKDTPDNFKLIEHIYGNDGDGFAVWLEKFQNITKAV